MVGPGFWQTSFESKMARINNLPVLFLILRGAGPLLLLLSFGKMVRLRDILGFLFGGFTKLSFEAIFMKRRMSSILKQDSILYLI